MAATLLGSLLVSLGLESGEFKSGLSQAEKQFNASRRRIEKAGQGMADLGSKMSLAVTAPLVALGVASVKAATESKAAIAQVDAALVSMGNAAGFTSEQLQGLATGIMKKSLEDDDDILKSVTANMLTFGNVSGDVFARAQQAAVDLSARLGQDLQSSAIQVGKALNDPVKGVTALQRVGVSFSAQQKEQITTMIETGRAADAQRLILAELEKQFGGAAEAARKANPFGALKQSFNEFQEQVGAKLLDVLPAITDAIMSVLDAFNSLSPGMQKAVVMGGLLAAAFGPVLTVMGAMVQIGAPLIAILGQITTAAVAQSTAVGALTVGWAGLRAMLVTLLLRLGPYAAVLAAIGAGLYYVWHQTMGTRAATAAYAKAQGESEKATEAAETAAMGLASAHGQARVQALALAKAERELAKQKLESARASIIEARAELFRAKARTERLRESDNAAVQFGGADPSFAGLGASLTVGQGGERKAEANVAAAEQTFRNWQGTLDKLDAVINAGAPAPINISSVGGGKSPKGGGASKASGPSSADIEARFQQERIGYITRSNDAQASIARSTEERAEFELRNVEWARIQTRKSIESDTDYSATQKKRLLELVEALALDERARVEHEKNRQLEQEAQQLADARFDAERDSLQIQMDLADNQADRKRIALEILDAEREHLKASLEAVIASKTIADADKQRAQIALDALNANAAAQREAVSRQNETNAERFVRDINKTPAQMNEAFDQIKIDGLNALNEGLTDAIVNFKSLGDVARSILQQILSDLIRLQIQKAIIGPLAGALGLGGGGGSSGLLGGILGSVGGGGGGGLSKAALKLAAFADGTNFAPGGLALVGEQGPELVNLPRGSQVIPNHELQGMGQRTEVHRPTFVFPGVTNPREAREAAGQAARRYRRELTPMKNVA